MSDRRGLTRAARCGWASLVLVAGCAGTYRLDGQRAAEVPAADVLRLRWHRQVSWPDVFDFRPQEFAGATWAADGRVFVGSSAGRFYALDRDGRTLWVVRTAGAVSSTPLFEPQLKTVFFGADDGVLYAVDAESGKVRWRHSTQGTLSHPPVHWEGLLIFTSSEDRVYALDAVSGRWRWQYDREAPEGFTIQGFAGVLVHKGMVYTGFSDGVAVALKATSGEVVWTRNLSGGKSRFTDVDATPVLMDDDTVVTASYGSGVHALVADTGSVRWQFAVEGASRVVVAGARLYLTAPQAGLIALDRMGRELWRQAMPKGVPSPPALLGRFLFVAGTETGLFVAAAEDGELLQYFDPGHGISGPPSVMGDDSVVVLSNHGHLFAFAVRGAR